MRMSELSERSGVPVATIKFYQREGLLPPGQAVNPRQTAYADEHVVRLRLIRGLVQVLGASIEQVRHVVEVIDAPGLTVLEAMTRATHAIPPAGPDGPEGGSEVRSTNATSKLLIDLGLRHAPQSPHVEHLDAALSLAAEVGIEIDTEQMRSYVAAVRDVARADFDRIPWQDPKEAVQFAVLGTVLYEPVLLALRRLAHAEVGMGMSDGT